MNAAPILASVFLVGAGPAVGAQSELFRELHRVLPAYGGTTRAIAVGDVDGDGDRDAAVASTLQDRLLLNDGAAAFTDATHLLPADPSATRDLLLVDLNGDTRLDLMLAKNGQNLLLHGDGKGLFSDASSLLPVLADDTWALAAGDVNGSGNLDLWLGNGGPDRLLVNAGAPGFVDTMLALPADSDWTRSIALGDVDGDGDLDALFGTYGQYGGAGVAERLYLNDGVGGYADASSQLPIVLDSVVAVALSDLDGDLDLDAVIGTGDVYAGILNRLLVNDGAGNFSEPSGLWPTSVSATLDLALGDAECDGDLDILVGMDELPQGYGHSDHLYLNDGSGTFAAGGSLPPHPHGTSALAWKDLDGDCDPDALVGRSGVDALWLNDGTGVFVAPPPQVEDADDVRAHADVDLGDVDGDGDLDAVLATCMDSNMWLIPHKNFLLENDGYGVFKFAKTKISVPPPEERGLSNAIGLADTDGDGDLDLLAGHENDYDGGGGGMHFYRNDGTGAFTKETGIFGLLHSETMDFALGDLDADGDLDLYTVGHPGTNDLNLNDGTGVFTNANGQLPPQVLDGSEAVALVDVEADGDLDVYVGNNYHTFSASFQDNLFLNDGLANFSDGTSQLPVDQSNTMDVDFGDVDGDGDPDALLATKGGIATGDRLYLNDGLGYFTESASALPAAAQAHRVARLADLDGDSLPDAWLDGQVYLNDQAGGFTELHDFASVYGMDVYGVALGDVDDDGDTDALVVAKYASVSVLFSNVSRQVAGRGPLRIGKAFTLDLYGNPQGTAIVLVSAAPLSLPLPGLGTLGLDPASMLIVHAGMLDPTGRDSLFFQAPSNPAHVGSTLWWQALQDEFPPLSNVEPSAIGEL